MLLLLLCALSVARRGSVSKRERGARWSMRFRRAGLLARERRRERGGWDRDRERHGVGSSLDDVCLFAHCAGSRSRASRALLFAPPPPTTPTPRPSLEPAADAASSLLDARPTSPPSTPSPSPTPHPHPHHIIITTAKPILPSRESLSRAQQAKTRTRAPILSEPPLPSREGDLPNPSATSPHALLAHTHSLSPSTLPRALNLPQETQCSAAPGLLRPRVRDFEQRRGFRRGAEQREEDARARIALCLSLCTPAPARARVLPCVQP